MVLFNGFFYGFCVLFWWYLVIFGFYFILAIPRKRTEDRPIPRYQMIVDPNQFIHEAEDGPVTGRFNKIKISFLFLFSF